MKNGRKVKSFCFFAVLFLVFFIVLDCRGPFLYNPPVENTPVGKPSEGHGIVRLKIADWLNDGPQRTILPQSPVFSFFKLSFEPLSGQELPEDIHIPANETVIVKDIELQAGKYIINAYGNAMFDGREEVIAEGSEMITVIAGKNIEASVTLRAKTPETGGQGIFDWKLIVPEGIGAASCSIMLYERNNETNVVIDELGIIDASGGEITISGSTLCENGYYFIKISIGTDRKRIIYFDLVHVYPNRASSYEQRVSADDFVDVLILDGSVDLSLRFNGMALYPDQFEIKQVWAYSATGEKTGFANVDKDGNWTMYIVKRNQVTDIHFAVIVLIKGHHQLELKWIETTQIYGDDVTGIPININRNLLRLDGTLNPHTVGYIPKSDWIVKAYTAQDNGDSTLALNEMPVKTDSNGRWSMTIDSFNSAAGVFFSVEKVFEGKKYKRVNLYELSVSESPIVTAIPLIAHFTPPRQIFVQFADGISRTMKLYDSRYTLTRNNRAEDTISNFINIQAYFDDDVVNYNYSNVVKQNRGLNYYNDNGTIAFDNDAPPGAPGQDNLNVTLDFRNDKYLDESASPVLVIEKSGEVFIEGGTSELGSPDSEHGREGPSGKSKETRHFVQLSPFYMGRYEVTQKMYEEVMGKINWEGKDTRFRGDNFPVVYSSWYDAIEYCNRRSETEGYAPVYKIMEIGSGKKNVIVDWNANGYRLPTEAEWEYSARAGSLEAFASFGAINNYGKFLNSSLANYNASQVDAYGYNPVAGAYSGRIVEVGRYPPNSWGLHDMHGNVWEMTNDFFGDYPASGIQVDPKGPADGNANSGTDVQAMAARGQRVIRGGSYFNSPRYLRSAHRGVIESGDADWNDIGFRLVRAFQFQ